MPKADSTPPPSFFARLFYLSWVAWLRTLFDAEFAAGVERLRAGAPALPSPREPEVEAPRPVAVPVPVVPPKKQVILKEAPPDAALQVLALFQREGRFIDFLQEDLSGYTNEQIGASTRVVHEGCRRALQEHVPVVPVRAEEEGTRITLEKGFDARAVQLSGHVTGEPPFRGTLTHRGWRAVEVKLPRTAEGHDPTVLRPAEVEL